MIADLFDDFSVRDRNLRDVRRVNDEFATVRDNRFQFVHAFALRPTGRHTSAASWRALS
jgi:hypothetical protein